MAHKDRATDRKHKLETLCPTVDYRFGNLAIKKNRLEQVLWLLEIFLGQFEAVVSQ